jgi:hypothetical protein
MLTRNCPDILPGIVAKMVEEQLRHDMREGRDPFLIDLVRAFDKRGTFRLIDLIPAKREMQSIVDKALISRAWSDDSVDPNKPAE